MRIASLAGVNRRDVREQQIFDLRRGGIKHDGHLYEAAVGIASRPSLRKNVD
jgi:hypothetical protein